MFRSFLSEGLIAFASSACLSALVVPSLGAKENSFIQSLDKQPENVLKGEFDFELGQIKVLQEFALKKYQNFNTESFRKRCENRREGFSLHINALVKDATLLEPEGYAARKQLILDDIKGYQMSLKFLLEYPERHNDTDRLLDSSLSPETKLYKQLKELLNENQLKFESFSCPISDLEFGLSEIKELLLAHQEEVAQKEHQYTKSTFAIIAVVLCIGIIYGLSRKRRETPLQNLDPLKNN